MNLKKELFFMFEIGRVKVKAVEYVDNESKNRMI